MATCGRNNHQWETKHDPEDKKRGYPAVTYQQCAKCGVQTMGNTSPFRTS